MRLTGFRWQEWMAISVSLLTMLLFSPWVRGQSAALPRPDSVDVPATESRRTGEMTVAEPTGPSTYVLGPGDLVLLRVLDLEEIGSAPYRIDMRGNLTLPMAGRIVAAGLSVEELEIALTRKLKAYLNDPQVTVTVQEMNSQPVSVLGSVKQPGVHQLQGQKTLLQMLSLAGGLAQDAGYTVRITRRKDKWGAIPLDSAHDDPSGEYSVAHVSVTEVMNAQAPEKNIAIKPDDVITVPKGDLVYVLGAVKKSGGFVLGDHEKVTTLHALAMAEGLAPHARDRDARLLRKLGNGSERDEISVNLKDILDGKRPDIPMRGDDILWIPTSTTKRVLSRTAEAGIAIGTGVAIWRR